MAGDVAAAQIHQHRRHQQQHQQQRGGGGAMGVPGRILSTLQRKFWDSNKIVSDNAVFARDFLAGVYVASKDKAGEVAGATVHKSLQAYRFARDQSTTMELPGPLKPVRDHIIVPSFRGVERSVDFLMSPRLGQAYQHLKEHGSNVPLVGRAVFLPSVEAAEGVTRFFLVVVQAPLPSAESVANVAEVSMDVGKRGLSMAFRELYFYMDLIDQQVTRTMTRAHWGLLGYGPYADLPLERREEVVDRACEKYLSLEHPIQRYEFLAHIRWHNAALHDDLVQTGLLRSRADAIRAVTATTTTQADEGRAAARQGQGSHNPHDPTPDLGTSATTGVNAAAAPCPSPFAGDAWLDAGAVWRRSSNWRREDETRVEGAAGAGAAGAAGAAGCGSNGVEDGSASGPCGYYRDGVVTTGVSESCVGWFRRSGGVWALPPAGVGGGGGGGGDGDGGGPWEAFTARECRRLEKVFRAHAATARTSRGFSTDFSAAKDNGAEETKGHGGPAADANRYPGGDGGGGGASMDTGGGSGNGGGRRGVSSVAYQPTGGMVLELNSYEVQPGDVLVEQGRHAVSLGEMIMRPVFWPFSGKGDEVCRAVWMQDTGARPYPRPLRKRSRGAALAGASAPGEDKAGFQTDDGREPEEEEDEEEGPVGLVPYPLRAAAILEDAYQFLAWHLECGGGAADRSSTYGAGSNGSKGGRGRAGGSSSSPTVLLTVQVADQLVQFRSLTDIVSVKRTLGGAFSVFGRRRVFRGIPVEEDDKEEEHQGDEDEEKEEAEEEEEEEEEEKGLETRHDNSTAPSHSASGSSKARPGFRNSGGGCDNCAPDPKNPNGGVAAANGCGVAAVDGGVRASAAPSTMDTGVSGAGAPPAPPAAFAGEGGGLGANGAASPSSPQGQGGEDADELDLDLDERVEHLVLVVHGIGDALMSVDLGVVQLRSLVECCDTMRAHHEEVVLNSKHLRGLRRKAEATEKGKKGGRGDAETGERGSAFDNQEGGEENGEEEEGDTGEGETRPPRQSQPTSAGDGTSQHQTAARAERHPGGSSTDRTSSTRTGSTHAKAPGGRARGGELPKGLGRVEYLPIEWHTRFKGRLYQEGSGSDGGARSARASSGSGFRASAGGTEEGLAGGGGGGGGGGLSIWDITLPRAPTLRAFTNDTLLDILYFMSPEYHQVIVEEVTQEINRVLELFRKHTRNWSGKVSIVAHSLGAIICFDIMANQPASQLGGTRAVPADAHPADSSPSSAGASAQGGEDEERKVSTVNKIGGGTEGGGQEDGEGCLRYYRGSTKFPALSARVENVFCLGSPIGMFLMIRGQHRRLGKAFKLPGCRRLFNIFHPYDPVAFRLEPLLRAGDGDGDVDGDFGNSMGPGSRSRSRSRGVDEPVILPTWTGGLRVHYQVQRWWQELWSRAWETKHRAEASIERSLESIGLIDEQPDYEDGGSGSGFRSHDSLFTPASSSDLAIAREEHARGEKEEGGTATSAACTTAALNETPVATAGTAITAAIHARAALTEKDAARAGGTVGRAGMEEERGEGRGQEVEEEQQQGQQEEVLLVSPRPSKPTQSLSPPARPATPPHSLALPPPSPRDDPSRSASPHVLPVRAAQRGEGADDDDDHGDDDDDNDDDDSSPENDHEPLATAPQGKVRGAAAGNAKGCQDEVVSAVGRSDALAAPEEVIGANLIPDGQEQPEQQQQQQQQHARHSGAKNGAAAAAARSARMAWRGAVMEEDIERNGALAGGRRVDYCLQEKEFEVTNEYIFALGSHVIYWSSKDVSLFVAQQVVADAVADADADENGV
eukprot:g7562.t1